MQPRNVGLVGVLLVMLVCCGDVRFSASLHAQSSSDSSASAKSSEMTSKNRAEETLPTGVKPEGFDAKDISAANTFVQSLNLADWLGPLAPVALSPFFGLTCLSGMAIWGPEWLQSNALLSASGPLKSEWLFAVFLTLTVLTSVPRMTKVSKLFAQAMDQLETYSVVVILLVVKLFADVGDATPEQATVVQLGIFSFTAQALLAIAMVVNLIVINSVKFFFEILIWLTPVPAIDAMFEIANKVLCAALMTVYAFSPTLATAINLLILVIALFIFRWVYRRLSFYRHVLADLVLSRLWPSYSEPSASTIHAFAKDNQDPFIAKSPYRLQVSDGQLMATQLGWIGNANHVLLLSEPPRLHRGWICHTLTATTEEGEPIEFHVSRRFDPRLDDWARQVNVQLKETSELAAMDVMKARSEFA